MIAGIGASRTTTTGHGDATFRPRFRAGRVRPERPAPEENGRRREAAAQPRTPRAPLDDIARPPAPLPAPALAAAAARAFSAGNGYVTGLLVDRII